MEVRSSLKKTMRDGKMAHRIRAPTTNTPDDVHSIPGAYRVKKRNNSYRLSFEHM